MRRLLHEARTFARTLQNDALVLAMRAMSVVRNTPLLTPEQQQALEERTRLCFALSDNFNEAINWHPAHDSLRNILLHQVGELDEIDYGGLPATIVADIENSLMEKIEMIVAAISVYQSTRIE